MQYNVNMQPCTVWLNLLFFEKSKLKIVQDWCITFLIRIIKCSDIWHLKSFKSSYRFFSIIKLICLSYYNEWIYYKKLNKKLFFWMIEWILSKVYLRQSCTAFPLCYFVL